MSGVISGQWFRLRQCSDSAGNSVSARNYAALLECSETLIDFSLLQTGIPNETQSLLLGAGDLLWDVSHDRTTFDLTIFLDGRVWPWYKDSPWERSHKY